MSAKIAIASLTYGACTAVLLLAAATKANDPTVALEQLRRGTNTAEAIATLKQHGLEELAVLVTAHADSPLLSDYLFEVFTQIALDVDQDERRKAAPLVPIFVKYIQHDRTNRRLSAFVALGHLGAVSREAIPALRDVARDSTDVRAAEHALRALQNIATDLSNPDVEINAVELEDALQALKGIENDAQHVAQMPAAPPPEVDIAGLTIAVDGVAQRLHNMRSGISFWLSQWYHDYSIVAIPVGIVIFLLVLPVAAWALVWVVNPIWLAVLRPRLGSRFAKLSGLDWFALTLRVLDAWVSSRIDGSVLASFVKLRTDLGQIYRIEVPVWQQGKATVLETAHLQQLFDQPTMQLVIEGNGGTGKTNLAFEIARLALEKAADRRLWKSHRAIPVFVTSLDDTIDIDLRLMHAVKQHLRSLTRQDYCLDGPLLEKLLVSRRIVVIIDGLSELGSSAIKALNPHFSHLPALVVTSRHGALMGSGSGTVLRPCDLNRSDLTAFVWSYIKKRCEVNRFTSEEEVRQEVVQLTNMKNNQHVTVLMAKMYADLMINARITTMHVDSSLPSNIPDLMYAYFNWLNRGEPQYDPNIYTAAKLLAWKCVEIHFRPGALSRKDAKDALCERGINGETLHHLTHRMQLLHITSSNLEYLRFTLDPLAEYLASTYLIESIQEDADRWDRILARLSKLQKERPEVSGLTSALTQCCAHMGPEHHVPPYVERWLRKQTRLEPI